MARKQGSGADGRGRVLTITEATRRSIADCIVETRRRHGMSQRDLAFLSGVRAETLSRLERGRADASIEAIARIQSVFRRLEPAGIVPRTGLPRARARRRRGIRPADRGDPSAASATPGIPRSASG